MKCVGGTQDLFKYEVCGKNDATQHKRLQSVHILDLLIFCQNLRMFFANYCHSKNFWDIFVSRKSRKSTTKNRLLFLWKKKRASVGSFYASCLSYLKTSIIISMNSAASP